MIWGIDVKDALKDLSSFRATTGDGLRLRRGVYALPDSQCKALRKLDWLVLGCEHVVCCYCVDNFVQSLNNLLLG